MNSIILFVFLATGPQIISISSWTMEECVKQQQHLDKRGIVSVCVESNGEQDFKNSMVMVEKVIDAVAKIANKLDKEIK